MKYSHLFLTVVILFSISSVELLSQQTDSTSKNEIINLLEISPEAEDQKVSLSEFKKNGGITIKTGCCDHKDGCTILGYNFLRARKNEDTIRVVNPGSTYNGDAKRLIESGIIGDIYIYKNLKYKCPDSDNYIKLDEIVFDLN